MAWADLDRITQALARVQGELLGLADDAFAERHELLQRRDQLRREAAAFRVDFDTRRPTEDMLDELSGLRSHLSELEGRRIDMVKQSGGSAAGPGAEGLGRGVAQPADRCRRRDAGGQSQDRQDQGHPHRPGCRDPGRAVTDPDLRRFR